MISGQRQLPFEPIDLRGVEPLVAVVDSDESLLSAACLAQGVGLEGQGDGTAQVGPESPDRPRRMGEGSALGAP